MQFSSKSIALLSLAPMVNAFVAPNGNKSPSTKLYAGNDEMSKALPFVKKPANLDGSFPGDVGFE